MFRDVLVLSQAAFAVFLLLEAGVLVKSFYKLSHVRLGYETSPLMSATVTLGSEAYSDGADILRYTSRLIQQISEDPATGGVAIGTPPLFSGDPVTENVTTQGSNPINSLETLSHQVSPGYFRTLGVRLLAGREFEERDLDLKSHATIINDRLARLYSTPADAIGSRISLDGPAGPWKTVVGVVNSVREEAADREARPGIYLPYTYFPNNYFGLIVRMKPVAGLDPAVIRRGAAKVDPEQPVDDVQSLDQLIAGSEKAHRTYAAVFSGFSSAAFLIAVAGVYGMILFALNQKRKELGIRLALGATRADIVRFIVQRDALRLLCGLGAGFALAALNANAIAKLAYQVAPLDRSVVLSSSLGVLVILAGACILAMRRTVSSSAADALRNE